MKEMQMANDPVPGQSEAVVGDSAPAPSPETAWFDTLPEGLRSEPSLASFKGKPISAVVESHVNAQKLIGGSIRLPAEKATPEERAKVLSEAYGKLGRPESPDKYTFKLPVVDGVEIPDAQVKAFLPVAHRLGLNSYQVEELLKFDADITKASAPNHLADYENCMKSLTDGDDNSPGWGSTADRYINTAKRTLETMFHPSVAAQIVASGVGNNPEFVRGMARIGKELIEDGLIIGEEKGPDNSSSAGLLKELEQMMGDPKSAYHDRSHPGHEAAVNRAVDIRRFMSTTPTTA